MRRSRFRLIRELQIAYAIPELRKSVVVGFAYSMLFYISLPVSLLIRLPWAFAAIISVLGEVCSRIADNYLDFQTPSGYFRNKVTDNVYHSQTSIMKASGIRARMGWDQEDAVISSKG